MAKFAIERASGEVHAAEGSSVEDVIARYGAPGNGNVVAWNDDVHVADETFETPDDQATWYKAHFNPDGSEKKAAKADTKEGK